MHKYLNTLGLMILLSVNHQLGHAQAVADREQQLLLDVQRSEFADSYETLLAGEREVVVVTQESTTPLTKGVALIIGESGLGPFNQNSAAELANMMNQYGWVSMVMPAPTSAFFAPLEASPAVAAQNASNETEPSSDTEQSVHPRQGPVVLEEAEFNQQEQQLMLQLQAIVPKTQQYPGFFLVIAQGTSAAWLGKIYSEQKLGLPDALIVVNPYWPQRAYNQQIPEILANTQMPVLDVFSRWDNKWGKRTVADRKVAAEKNLKLHYRQRELIGQMIDKEQYRLLSKEIYGWLTQMGW